MRLDEFNCLPRDLRCVVSDPGEEGRRAIVLPRAADVKQSGHGRNSALLEVVPLVHCFRDVKPGGIIMVSESSRWPRFGARRNAFRFAAKGQVGFRFFAPQFPLKRRPGKPYPGSDRC